MSITLIILKDKAEIKKMSKPEFTSYHQELKNEFYKHLSIQENCKDFLDKELIEISKRHTSKDSSLVTLMSWMESSLR